MLDSLAIFGFACAQRPGVVEDARQETRRGRCVQDDEERSRQAAGEAADDSRSGSMPPADAPMTMMSRLGTATPGEG